MRLLFLGDFFYNYDRINDDILEISKFIKENDLITILNFDAPLEARFKDKKINKPFCSKKSIEVLKLLNVRAVNLANNSILDYSTRGFKRLLELLDKNGIGHFGAGMDKYESLKPYILEQDGQKIHFYGFGWPDEGCVEATAKRPGIAFLDFNVIENIVNKREAPHFIFSFHGGYEYEKLPQPLHFKNFRELSYKKRVKAIVGHHHKVVQAYDKRNNIFYGLGNFYVGSKRKLYNKNDKYYEDFNCGIGVILETREWKSKIIKFISDGENTKIDNDIEIKGLVDTCRIPIHKYPKYFRKHNNNMNKTFVYGVSSFHVKFWNKTNFIRRRFYQKIINKILNPVKRIIQKINIKV